MNRIHFFVLTGLSTLVVVLIAANLFLAHQVGVVTQQVQVARGDLQQSQAFKNNLQQLALRIYQDAQKTQDAGLKDIINREQINYTPPPATGASDATPAPAK